MFSKRGAIAMSLLIKLIIALILLVTVIYIIGAKFGPKMDSSVTTLGGFW